MGEAQARRPRGADLVFLDPDNGVCDDAAKYAYLPEIQKLRRPARAIVFTVLTPQQMAQFEQLISKVDKGAGGQPPSVVALQADGTEARGQPSSSGFDRRPGMGRDGPTGRSRDMQNAFYRGGPRAFRGTPRPGGGMAGDSATREIETFLGFKLPESGGSFGVQARPSRYERGARMAYDSSSQRYRDDPRLSIKAITGVDINRIRVVGG